MSLNLRQAIHREIAIGSATFFGIASVLTWFARGFVLNLNVEMWIAFFALLVGLVRGWQKSAKLKRSILRSIPQRHSLKKIARNTCSVLHFDGAMIDWPSMDDHATQLLNLGYTHLGDFIAYPPHKRQLGVAACYLNRSSSILVEVQYIVHDPALRPQDTRPGLHFSFCSVVGGHIHVMTSDHHPNAHNALLRGEHDVGACYPQLGLIALMDKHQRILASVQKRTNKKVTRGLSMERYVLLARERFAWAHQRLARLDGLALAQEIDWFDANPQYKWTPPSLMLAAVANRDWHDLERTLGEPSNSMIIADGPDTIVSDNPEQAALEQALAEELAREAHVAAAMPGVLNAANWLGWIALLSLLNCVLAALDSPYVFATGLAFVRECELLISNPGMSMASQWLWHGLSYAAMISLGALAWWARKPAKMAFVVGMGLLALDSLLFFLRFDVVGVVIHGFALYQLWRGFGMLRELEQVLDFDLEQQGT